MRRASAALAMPPVGLMVLRLLDFGLWLDPLQSRSQAAPAALARQENAPLHYSPCWEFSFENFLPLAFRLGAMGSGHHGPLKARGV